MKKQSEKVALVRMCKTPGGWQRFRAVISKNGKVKPNAVIEGGKEAIYTEGYYQVRSYDRGRKIIYTRVEGGPAEAAAELKKEQALRKADNEYREHGVPVPVRDPNAPASLRDSVDDYLKHLNERGRKEAHEQAKQMLNALIEHGCEHVQTVKEITGKHLLAHYEWLRTKGCKRATAAGAEKVGCSERTIHNKHGRIRSFLIHCGIDTNRLMKGLLDKLEKKVVTTYSAADLKAIRNAAIDHAPEMVLVIEMALGLGLREQELKYATFSDVNEATKIFKVTSKPEYGHKIKDKEQREVPISDELLQRLKDRRKERPGAKLILGTANDTPDGHMLRSLKRMVSRAGLDCGTCAACKKGTGCALWTLHKFRRTFMTSLLRSGWDLATVQSYAGHSDMKSTIRYLKAATAPEMQKRINTVSWGA